MRPLTDPFACADCGTPQDHHGRRWTRTASLHSWIRPSDALIKARMLARRASR